MDNVHAKDVLRRAYKMEEEMTQMILDLISPEMIPDQLDGRNKSKILRMLTLLKSESLRHKKVAEEILKKLSK